MRIWTLTLISLAAAVGCGQIDSDRPMTTPGPATNAPDNTAVNQRDANPNATQTPIDQNENEADVKKTAEIRKRIVDTPDLSVNARNAKIITANGQVTLRGPVDSESERELLGKIALAVAGEGNVENQLEVAAGR